MERGHPRAVVGLGVRGADVLAARLRPALAAVDAAVVSDVPGAVHRCAGPATAPRALVRCGDDRDVLRHAALVRLGLELLRIRLCVPRHAVAWVGVALCPGAGGAQCGVAGVGALARLSMDGAGLDAAHHRGDRHAGACRPPAACAGCGTAAVARRGPAPGRGCRARAHRARPARPARAHAVDGRAEGRSRVAAGRPRSRWRPPRDRRGRRHRTRCARAGAPGGQRHPRGRARRRARIVALAARDRWDHVRLRARRPRRRRRPAARGGNGLGDDAARGRHQSAAPRRRAYRAGDVLARRRCDPPAGGR